MSITDTPEKILVMDDEENIRTITCILLEKMGYNPMATPDGETAVEEYRRSFLAGEPFDAVIMDITIPDGMGATEAIKKLKAIDPDVCAIVTSGFVSEMNSDDFLRQGFSGVLRKPYRSANLREILESVAVSKN
ncbi:response regulator [Methanogenium cariaci]|jgi:CheY-like chemotaxis protein